MTRAAIHAEIDAERDRQDRMWGGPDHDNLHTPNDWVAYLAKHLGKAVHWPWTPEGFRKQMVVVGALAVAAIEWVERPVSRVEGSGTKGCGHG